MSCNENLAQLAGLDSPHALYGKNDFEVLWQDRAEQYRKDDISALSGRQINSFELMTTIHGIIEVAVIKCPLVDQRGKTIGTLGSSIDITTKFIGNKSGYFNREGNLYVGEPFNIYLTKREVTILRYILSGYSAKQIGREINRSFRTVDSHTESIKKKLQCRTKGDIVYVCIQFGLAYLCHSRYYFPNGLK